ncbi:MAG: hypothetical protein P4L99_03550 [Chthoniobacter sp.]|nr:hypothetical protein [Chthoniobacter sp.]
MVHSNSFSGGSRGRWGVPAPTFGGSNIDSQRFATAFAVCGVLYLCIYALEAPIRYGLFLAGKDSLILLRDGLMIGPLVLLFAVQVLRLRLQPAFWVSAILVLFHGLVLMGTIGSFSGVAFGIKVLMNLLFGFFAASLLISPGDRTLKVVMVIWLLIVIGVCLDKFVLTFPWTGIKTVIGDLNVDVSKDWQIQDPFARRVAGFTRSSIAVAAVLPCLTIVLLCRTKNLLVRVIIAAVAVGGVFLTTQKGSVIAFAPIAAILCLPNARLPRLRACFLAFLVIAVGLPLLTSDLHMDHGAGVFSTESLYLRIAYTWPDAWRWIDRHQMLCFGVGLGGIGGPQRLYAPDNFNPVDNIIVLLYGYFGVFAIFYCAIISFLALRPVTGSRQRVETAVAIVAFAFGYGAVLSVIEDQSASLFLGAALGVLWRETGTGRPFAQEIALSPS